MSIKLNAVARLNIARKLQSGKVSAIHTNLDAPNGQYGGDGIGEEQHSEHDLIDAAFDKERDHDLKILVLPLNKIGLPFSLKDSCLICRVPMKKGTWLSSETVKVLSELGMPLYVRGDMLTKPKFALKGPKGLVYQRLDAVHRIFYTK